MTQGRFAYTLILLVAFVAILFVAVLVHGCNPDPRPPPPEPTTEPTTPHEDTTEPTLPDTGAGRHR